MPELHPIKDVWDNSFALNMQKMIDSGWVNRVEGPDGLVLYNYTEKCVYDRAWNPYTLSARGLVVNHLDEIVALPFPKFFNVFENDDKIPDLPFSVSEKMDGSLGIVYWDGKWRVNTRGSFQSSQAKWAVEWLHNNVSLDQLCYNTTYLVEIVYPENRIVVPYTEKQKGLYLLGAFLVSEFIEYEPEMICEMAKQLGFFSPKKYDYDSIEDILYICKNLPYTDEGFVVRFSNGHRVKIKGDEYLRVHRLISNVTPLGIWDAMRNNDDLDIVRKQIPEEFHKDFDAIRRLLLRQMYAVLDIVELRHKKTKHMSDKDIGIQMQAGNWDDGDPVLTAEKSFLFPARKLDMLNSCGESGRMRDKLFNFFRPKNNYLEGYVPSSSMNAFEIDS